MWKYLVAFVAGIALVALLAMAFMAQLMFTEHSSPFGFEETVARIQHNIDEDPLLKEHGWALSGLRNPAKAVHSTGGMAARQPLATGYVES